MFLLSSFYWFYSQTHKKLFLFFAASSRRESEQRNLVRMPFVGGRELLFCWCDWKVFSMTFFWLVVVETPNVSIWLWMWGDLSVALSSLFVFFFVFFYFDLLWSTCHVRSVCFVHDVFFETYWRFFCIFTLLFALILLIFCRHITEH